MNTQNETNADNRPSLKNLFIQRNEDGEVERKIPSVDELKAALEAGADVNESIQKIVEIVVMGGQAEQLQLLLEYGANVSGEGGFRLLEMAFTRYPWPFSPDKKAAFKEIVRILISNGVSPNVRNKHLQTLLMTSADDLEKTVFLIECGADVNAQDIAGRTALSYVCSRYNRISRKRKLVALLQDAGADINLCDHRHRSPLMYAVNLGGDTLLLNTLQYLIERGADPTICDIYGFSLSDYARFYMASPKVQRYINQLLHKPADNDIIEQSPQSDEELNEDEDYDGGNLLHKLFSDSSWTDIFRRKMRDEYSVELVRRLCMTGLDVNERDNKGCTPLMYAAKHKRSSEAYVSLLLEYGADPSIRDANGFTALNYAQFADASPEVLELLTPKE